MTTLAAICPICAGRKMYYAFSVAQSRLVECCDCGHMMLHPPPSQEELDLIYDENYALMQETGEERRQFAEMKQATARHYLDLVGACLGRHAGRLLEIGCGAGDLLTAAARLGYDVTGVEPSEYSCAQAREKLGIAGRVVCGDITSLTEKNYYDVCVLADVVEHVSDPRDFLNRVNALVRPGGIVVIATPSLDSWSARMMRTKWMEFKTEHIQYFRQETLHSLLFQTGLLPIAALPGYKFLSLEYIAGHFAKYPVHMVSFALRQLSAVLPAALRKKPFKVVASGIVSVSVKTPAPAHRKLSIILPVYNEAATLEPVLRSVLEKKIEGLQKEVVIVESNSNDGTRDIVLKYRDHPEVVIVLEDRAQGKGHAVRTALGHATGDFILIQDGDREYDIEDYDVLLEPLVSGRSSFILGSRHGGRTWKVRRFKGKPFTGLLLNFGHWFFKTLVNVAFRLKLDDPFTMYKIFRRDCLSGLKFECNRFDFDYELLIKVVRKGYRPVEIPVNYRSRSFSEGKKVSVVRDPWTWIRAIFKYRCVPLNILETWRANQIAKSLPGLDTADGLVPRASIGGLYERPGESVVPSAGPSRI
uniref:Glycosyl transferase, family 2 n=1 Tax=Solibacter usitatus (strain Ellin6076) TaxID=234267 RepID=Q01PM1_SOLUE